jgi:DNA topoisomerase-1
VAKHLGNTRTVTKKYYVHPLIIETYVDGRIEKYLTDDFTTDDKEVKNELLPEEKTLMKILTSESHTSKISLL